MEYDSYKWTMPTTRFLAYIGIMNKASEPASPHKLKADKLKNTLTPKEFKELYD
jgi:hypothetical protein